MSPPLQLPRPIAQSDLDQAKKLVRVAAANQWPTLMADLDLMNSLYYPVRQVPLPGFQAEMLLWQNDKLNIFSQSGSKLMFKAVGPADLASERSVVKYKRTDQYTVLALVSWGNVGVVFTNEVSQIVWEIIGVFVLPDLAKQLKANADTLVDYGLIESSFARRESELENDAQGNESDDDYWNKYGQSSDPDDKPQNPSSLVDDNDSENSYWSRHGQQTSIDEDSTAKPKIRRFAVQVILDLAKLYRDCGVHEPNLIIDDIESIAFALEPPSSSIPSVARRHAERTIRLVQDDNVYFEAEINAAVEELKSSLICP